MIKKSQEIARTLSHSKLSVTNIFYLEIMVRVLDPNDNIDFNLQTSIMVTLIAGLEYACIDHNHILKTLPCAYDNIV